MRNPETLAHALPRLPSETPHIRTRCWADGKNGGMCMQQGDWEHFNGLCEACAYEITGKG